MDPVTASIAASAIPTVASLFLNNGSRPSGPDYSAIMSYLNSPEMTGYRNALMETAFNPNSDIYRIASDQAYAQSNRAVASRGLGTSGAALGYISNAQNDLANKFAETEFQKRLQAYSAVAGRDSAVAQLMSSMANSSYDANVRNYEYGANANAGLIKGIGGMANAGLSAYQQMLQGDANSNYLSGYGARTPGYQGSQPSAYVGGQPVYGSSFNYGVAGY